MWVQKAQPLRHMGKTWLIVVRRTCVRHKECMRRLCMEHVDGVRSKSERHNGNVRLVC